MDEIITLEKLSARVEAMRELLIISTALHKEHPRFEAVCNELEKMAGDNEAVKKELSLLAGLLRPSLISARKD
uniref:Uncharacterized protein n=1 Tax=Candidatus Kentrum sp. LPFa TaxID=2126335 RepID=A0A450WK86_9GAMM|nr:MAG: hypothetical protein BECKLPF1236B_GA0070989_111718 [Candidatus Kentron sp. LPFa]